MGRCFTQYIRITLVFKYLIKAITRISWLLIRQVATRSTEKQNKALKVRVLRHLPLGFLPQPRPKPLLPFTKALSLSFESPACPHLDPVAQARTGHTLHCHFQNQWTPPCGAACPSGGPVPSDGVLRPAEGTARPVWPFLAAGCHHCPSSQLLPSSRRLPEGEGGVGRLQSLVLRARDGRGCWEPSHLLDDRSSPRATC